MRCLPIPILPIPDTRSRIRYDDVVFDKRRLGKIARDLTGGRIRGSHGAHLDPDLIAGAYPRGEGWRPLLGQTGSAQGHLRNQGVEPGDLFLFFGVFATPKCITGAGGLYPDPVRSMPFGVGSILTRFILLTNWVRMPCHGPGIIRTSTASRIQAIRSTRPHCRFHWQAAQRFGPAVACFRSFARTWS